MNVIIDTREKNPWDLEQNQYITEIIYRKLDAGDYSVEGLETWLSIERKATVCEVAQNITKKHFWNSMNRLAVDVTFPFLICEFSIADVYNYPNVKCLPKRQQTKSKISPVFIMSSFLRIMGMGIQVIYADNVYHATKMATSILNRGIKRHVKS